MKTIQSAENAVKAFQEKGKSALIHVVEAMRIPVAFPKSKTAFLMRRNLCAQSAGQLDVIRGELHEVGGHMKNAGRVILGKPAKQTGTLEADKGALAKLRSFLESCGKAFSNMERSADRLMEKNAAHQRAGGKEAHRLNPNCASLKPNILKNPKRRLSKNRRGKAGGLYS